MISPLSEWDVVEEVQLPSKRVVKLRQLDVISLIAENGDIPNFLMAQINGRASQQKDITAAELMRFLPFLNQLARLMFVEPAIVSAEEARAGLGITLGQVPLNDKLALVTYGMGGAGAVSAVERFPEPQGGQLQAVSAGAAST